MQPVVFSMLLLIAGTGWTVAADSAIDDAVRQLVSGLESSDRDTRQRATVLANNLPAEAFDALRAQLARQDLQPPARTALERAMKFVSSRHARLQRVQDAVRWEQQFDLDCYAKYGTHDPKWDQAARDALRLAVIPSDSVDAIRLVIAQPQSAGAKSDLEAAWQACRKAYGAGCRDPLVLYRFAQLGVRRKLMTIDVLQRFQAASDAVADSKYPDYIKCRIFMSAVSSNATSRIEDATRLLPTALRGAGLTDARAEELLDALRTSQMQRFGGPDDVLKLLEAPFEAAFPKSARPLVMKGTAYVEWASQAPGGGSANAVTPEESKLMKERLGIAGQALEEAWNRDPSDARAPTEMLEVCRGLGSSLENTTTWFTRALAADPDDYEACKQMLIYLNPRWYGTPPQMLAFGRECLRTYNWRAQLPSILISAHQVLAAESGDQKSYYRQPEVWNDLQQVYQSRLWVEPGNVAIRNDFAAPACRCGQWQEARTQLQLLGNQVDPAAFGGKAMLDYFRRKANRLSAASTRPVIPSETP